MPPFKPLNLLFAKFESLHKSANHETQALRKGKGYLPVLGQATDALATSLGLH